MKLFIAFAAFTAFAPSAIAQQPVAPNPADPGAKVPAVKYESAFAGYAPYREEKLAPWREVNDEVGKVKGHVGIFGGAGHGGHGSSGQPGLSKPTPGKPAAASSKEPAGQPPVRSAPASPDAQRKGH